MEDYKKTRIDPRVIRTRGLLKEAFIDLLQEMEIDKISVNKLAERSTINRVTFYLHYRDIPDMMEKMAGEMEADVRSVLQQLPESPQSAEERETLIWVKLLEHIAENSKFYMIILGSRRTPVFTERMLKVLLETMAAKIDSLGSESVLNQSGVPNDIAIWYGSSALIGTIVAWLRHEMPYRPLYLARHLSTLLRNNYLVE